MERRALDHHDLDQEQVLWLGVILNYEEFILCILLVFSVGSV